MTADSGSPVRPSALPIYRGMNAAGVPSRDVEAYSLRKAILASATRDWKEAGLEREIDQELRKSLKRDTEGLLIPPEVFTKAMMRTQSTTGSAGGYLVETVNLLEEFVDVLRNASICGRAGARFLTGLEGNVEIPKKTVGSTGYWVTEDADITLSDLTFGQIAPTPKSVGGLVRMTRRLLLQTGNDVEQFIRQDIIDMLGVAIDAAAINGSGGAQPVGLLSTVGIGDVSFGSAGGQPTWPTILEFLQDVGTSNAPSTQLKWVTNAKAQAKLLATVKVANYPVYLWESAPPGSGADGMIAGYPAFVSNNVPSNLTEGVGSNLSALVFGDWSYLVVFQWGVVEIVVNPFENFASGRVSVRGMADVDTGLRNAAVFSASKDLITVL
jgi:HK97 family phage major capsid protein